MNKITNEITTQHQFPREVIFEAIDSANIADTTKHQYKRAIERYLDETDEDNRIKNNRITNPIQLSQYAEKLPKSSQAFLKAAVRLVVKNEEHKLKSGATPENIPQVTAGLYRLDALNEAIKPPPTNGTKTHCWLSPQQVKKLLSHCDNGELEKRRDWIILALMVGAGLRRTELTNLKFTDLHEQPKNNGDPRYVLSIKGKGAKNRTVPIHDKLARRIIKWRDTVGPGYIARSLGMKKEIGESISPIGVFNIVRKYGEMIDKPKLAPHDLRRTYAQLGYAAGVPISQISVLLGHANIATTQRYLNLELDLEATVSDFIPL